MSNRQAKRLKLQPKAESSNRAESLDKTATDPLGKLVPDVHDLIFQHLSASDVMNCFLVSKSWNQAMINSCQALSKLKFVLSDKNSETFSREDVWLFENSKRRYKNAEMKILHAQGMYKKMKILKKVSESLENLKICGIFSFNLIFPDDLSLPKLKTLQLDILEKEENHSVLRCTSDCLLELKIGYIKSENLFSVPMPPITAKLVSLEIDDMIPGDDQQRLKEFLSTMSSSLKSLLIGLVHHDVIEFVLGEMKALEVLKIDSNQLETAAGTENRTITTLKLQTYNFKGKPYVGLRAFKNLETLEISWCAEAALQRVLRECSDGLQIRIGTWMGDEHPSDVYEDLIELEPSVARNITLLEVA